MHRKERPKSQRRERLPKGGGGGKKKKINSETGASVVS